jgi:hypothetical protein
VLSVFEFASARGDDPVVVRAFNPPGRSTATSRSARSSRPTATTIHSSSTRRPASSRSAGWGRALLHPIIGVERDDGAIAASATARRAARESVMHFDLGAGSTTRAAGLERGAARF